MIGPTSSGVVARSLAAGGPERAAACVLLRLLLRNNMPSRFSPCVGLGRKHGSALDMAKGIMGRVHWLRAADRLFAGLNSAVCYNCAASCSAV